jgi:hypothetical protein
MRKRKYALRSPEISGPLHEDEETDKLLADFDKFMEDTKEDIKSFKLVMKRRNKKVCTHYVLLYAYMIIYTALLTLATILV